MGIDKRKRFAFSLVLVAFNLTLFTTAYLASIVWRCHIYSDKHSRWIGSAYESNKDFGYFPKPNSLAYHSLLFGEKVPVLFDENGFRVPANQEADIDPPERKILFLGGSFTHGYGVPAEKTFAYLAAQQLGAHALNAGGSGWGLSHVLLRAQREIPRHRPDWVVVQYSHWLVKRAMRLYGPTNWGKSPSPYFYESDGEVRIHEPVFMTANFRLPISDYAQTGLLPFAWNVGVPLFVYDDLQVAKTLLRRAAGRLPSPVSSRQAVVDATFSGIQRLCEETGAKMLILKMPGGFNDPPPYRDRLPDLDCAVADPFEDLVAGLPEASYEAWEKSYYFWRGEPLQQVDRHPNEASHAILARVIAETIRDAEAQEQAPAAPAGR